LVTASGETSICFGESVTLQSEPNAIAWKWLKDGSPVSDNQKFVAESSGQYAVEVTYAENCKDTSLEINVTVNPDITFTVDSFPAYCDQSNGSITIKDVSGGSSNNYKYSINSGDYQDSDTFPNLAPGTYQIRVSDGKCESALARNVTVPRFNAPVNLEINNPPTYCDGTLVDLTDPSITKGSNDNLLFSYWKNEIATDSVANQKP
jgi:hypothetical protein